MGISGELQIYILHFRRKIGFAVFPGVKNVIKPLHIIYRNLSLESQLDMNLEDTLQPVHAFLT